MPLSFLRVLSRKDLHWRQGLACWTGMWIHWKSLHKRWTQIGVSSCSKYQGYNNGQNTQIPTLTDLHWGIGGGDGETIKSMIQCIRRWWCQVEIQSKEGQAKGVEWVCSFKTWSGKTTEMGDTASPVSLPGRGKKYKGLEASKNKVGTEEMRTNCESLRLWALWHLLWR